ncbi:MAG: hypothetical protein U0271_38445 [Polyangiaceae bacterium]
MATSSGITMLLLSSGYPFGGKRGGFGGGRLSPNDRALSRRQPCPVVAPVRRARPLTRCHSSASIGPMVADSGVVLGIDVGWSSVHKTTGVCVLSWTLTEVFVNPLRLQAGEDAGLKGPIGDRPILALAIEGPIRGGLDEIGIYRLAEQMLTRGFARYIGKPGQSSSGNGRKLNAGANRMAQSVLALNKLVMAEHRARIHERAVVEAFPTSFLGVMLDARRAPPHGPRSDVYFQHLLGPSANIVAPPATDRLVGLLGRLLPGRQLARGSFAQIEDHEERAALVCALTALSVAARQYVAVGDDNGYIILPPRAEAGEPGLQPWAWEILERNRPANSKDAIIVERSPAR